MRNSTLRRKARRQAFLSWVSKDISWEELHAVRVACRDDEVLTRWNQEITRARLNPWENGGVLTSGSGFGNAVSNLWDWFKANWPEILKILMTILPLILAEKNKNAHSKPIWSEEHSLPMED
jgi:hypothetical protein